MKPTKPRISISGWKCRCLTIPAIYIFIWAKPTYIVVVHFDSHSTKLSSQIASDCVVTYTLAWLEDELVVSAQFTFFLTLNLWRLGRAYEPFEFYLDMMTSVHISNSKVFNINRKSRLEQWRSSSRRRVLFGEITICDKPIFTFESLKLHLENRCA